MFWKKKTSDSPAIIEYDDQREAFRYVFQPEDRLSMVFKGKSVSVLDISAGGMAFTDQGFEKYDTDTISLDLDIPNYRGETRLSAQVRILHLTREGICHSIFESCGVDEYERIHKYVLEMQKQDLRYK